MLASAAERLIEIDDGLSLGELAVDLVHLRVEEARLCCQHFQICCVTGFEKLLGVILSFLKIVNLQNEQFRFLAVVLEVCQGV